MHKCKLCGATSDETAFYARVNSHCAECHRQKVRENRKENAEYYKKYDAYRYRNDPKVKDRIRKYAKTEKGRKAARKSQAAWLKSDPVKRACHVILGLAIRRGGTAKPNRCSKCGSTGRIEGHHEDYSNPLDAVWLCRRCHAAHHSKYDENGSESAQ